MAGDGFKVRVFSLTKRILIVNAMLVSLLSSLCGQNVLIVYYSARGHTAALAEAVAKGAVCARRRFGEASIGGSGHQ